ncbi:aminoglycoside adenylyltransferase family protein [Xenorhabdus bharatensis]|uniref:aminoglycoside adenylyltransferase family protein n=1 Tax=Xenorhabdus bharatensis TaxID=3136256 RepID=UPI0030F43B7E
MTIPPEADNALLILQKRLAGSLVAVYLHGSVVAGGLRPNSDVDLLAVVNKPLTSEIRECLATDLMLISGRYPSDPDGRRPVELIVFLSTDLAALLYPARSEFIYGEWLRHQYEEGKMPKSICDPELTLVLAQSQQEAVILFGSHVNDLLPIIPISEIHRAIKDVLPGLIETLQGDERNVLLTLARMWRTLVTGEFVPKDIAADWAAARLPAIQSTVLADARKAYLSGNEDNWQSRQQELQLTVSSLRDYVLES